MTRGPQAAHGHFNLHGQYFDDDKPPILAPVPNKLFIGDPIGIRRSAAESKSLTQPPTAHTPRTPRTPYHILAEPRYMTPEWSPADSQSKVSQPCTHVHASENGGVCAVSPQTSKCFLTWVSSTANLAGGAETRPSNTQSRTASPASRCDALTGDCAVAFKEWLVVQQAHP
jgi:hypothetical protein